MKKPNAMVMVDAIKEESDAASGECRAAKSSNVIKIFLKNSDSGLSKNDVSRLFEIVFREYRGITGDQVIKINQHSDN